jgi:hypothetical protein
MEICWLILNEQPNKASKVLMPVIAPFPPPPLIGRVQDLLMTYTKVYRNFCYDIFGTMLLKNNKTDRKAFEDYKKYLDKYWKKIDNRRYPALQKKLWPKYSDPITFKLSI